MNNLSKSYKNNDGSEETVIASSKDNYSIKIERNYKLANHSEPKESRFTKKFKKSILGSDIGIKSGGFTSIAILASVIAISAFLAIYFLWRF